MVKKTGRGERGSVRLIKEGWVEEMAEERRVTKL